MMDEALILVSEKQQVIYGFETISYTSKISTSTNAKKQGLCSEKVSLFIVAYTNLPLAVGKSIQSKSG